MNATTNKTQQIKPLNPKGAETKYVGFEPEWKIQPDETNRLSRMARAFNWYTYHYGKKEAKEFIVHYLTNVGREKDAKTFRGVPDSKVRLTPGWMCRMSLMGLEMNEHEQCAVDNQISEMLKIKQEVKREQSEIDADTAASKLTIQDHLREKISECAGELEGMFDDFIKSGAKMSADFKPIALIRGMNVSPNMIDTISDIWRSKLTEFNEVIDGKDELLVEGYSNFTKVQMRQVVKFAEQVIADCDSYVQVKKAERKPRMKKAVSPQKLAAKFKYLREFPELKLKSLTADKLVGSSEAWLFDTAKRKLIHVVADAHVGTFTIKGGSIVGFDTLQTVQKTLRKPAEQLKEVLSGGKPAARKAFKDIKSTETKFSGRGNDNLIIIKA
jgi:hypothetical protein